MLSTSQPILLLPVCGLLVGALKPLERQILSDDSRESSLLAANTDGVLETGVTETTYSLAVSASTYILNITNPTNQSALTWFTTDLASANDMSTVMTGMRQLNATYDIWTRVCVPSEPSPRNQTLAVLTHGIGFGHEYFTSLADFLCKNGYPTVVYDRLGVGMSSKPDGIEEVQLPTEVAILGALINKVKNETSTTKVVPIGHSFGSEISHGLVAESPSSVDGLILTGFSLNSTGQKPFLAGASLEIASQNSPARFTGLNSSYLLTAGINQDQFLFMKYPYYDPAVLQTLQETKGTVTLGELVSQSANQKADGYTKPTYIVNGVYDLPFCAGNCTALDQDKDFKMAVPSSSDFTLELLPDAAHGIELHYIAGEGHQHILNWLDKRFAL